ncbi:MAG: hypothetical protein Q8M96_11870, partial [Rubrivivax sp.]|nr:hypothetical protein [Rubrivivax sp.]
VAAGLYFVAILNLDVTHAVANKLSLYVPLVRGQLDKNTAIGNLAAAYFSLALLFLPIGVAVLLWRQDLLLRTRVGIVNSGGIWRYVTAVYVLGVPLCMFILIFMYLAPIEIESDPRLFGQHVLHAMTNTYLGLLIFGSVGAVAASILLFVVLAALLQPVLFLVNLIWKD